MMAYDKDKLYEQALKIAEEENCMFIEHLVSFMPFSKETFYKLFPIGSDESDAIKSIIENNKVKRKAAMQNKWYDSENATLQVALYKLICNDDEHKRLINQPAQKEETSQKYIFMYPEP